MVNDSNSDNSLCFDTKFLMNKKKTCDILQETIAT